MNIQRAVKLGVVFDQLISDGGGYQQGVNAALLINELSSDVVKPVFYTIHKSNVKVLKFSGIDTKYIHLSLLDRLSLRIRRLFSNHRALAILRRIRRYNRFENVFIDDGVDLVYFVSPSRLALYLESTNYIATVWDLCHRDDLEFPEVRDGRIFEMRETLYQGILPKACAIIVDSALGKVNLGRRYLIDEDRIVVVPFSPGLAIRNFDYRSDVINVCSKYELSTPYVYYPAQFWAHKNHVYLLEGLKVLEDIYGHKVGAIFSGGDKGNLRHVKRTADQLGLADRVRFAGFVDDEEVPCLYKQALALVMPTYFGPTNIPPLEAFALGVPVLYSDKPGLRDQVGDAALLMDLSDPSSMASHLASIIEDAGVADGLVARGRLRLGRMSQQDSLGQLIAVLKKFQRRRMCW